MDLAVEVMREGRVEREDSVVIPQHSISYVNLCVCVCFEKNGNECAKYGTKNRHRAAPKESLSILSYRRRQHYMICDEHHPQQPSFLFCL